MPRLLSAPSDHRGLFTSYGMTEAASSVGCAGSTHPVCVSFAAGLSKLAGGIQVWGAPALPEFPPVFAPPSLEVPPLAVAESAPLSGAVVDPHPIEVTIASAAATASNRVAKNDPGAVTTPWRLDVARLT